MRNLVEAEKETRRRKLAQLHAVVAERKNELQRLNHQLESLRRVEKEQDALVDRLQSSDA